MEGSLIQMKLRFRNKHEEVSITYSDDEEKELIQIDDDEHTENGSDKYCEYPVGSPNTVIVRERDYLSLEHDTYLNDSVIDFYLNYVHEQILPEKFQEKVHIFSSFFYKRLLLEIPNSEKDLDLSVAEKRHARVSAWTKNVDIFSKSVLIIPICEDSHWYFLMVVGLSGMLPSSPFLSDPFVLVLDSMGEQRKKTARIIRQYLASEFEAKQVEGDCGFTDSDIPSIRPDKPEQPNGTDCGIYLLHYVEKIFRDISNFLTPDLPNLKQWFSREEVAKKRSCIAALVRSLSREQKPDQDIQFPNIPFTEGNAIDLKNIVVVDEDNEDDDLIEVFEVKNRVASVIERNPITITRISVPTEIKSDDSEILKDCYNDINWDEYTTELEQKVKLSTSNNNRIKNVANNNNDAKFVDTDLLRTMKTYEEPKLSLIHREELDSENTGLSIEKAKEETPAKGNGNLKSPSFLTNSTTPVKVSQRKRNCSSVAAEGIDKHGLKRPKLSIHEEINGRSPKKVKQDIPDKGNNISTSVDEKTPTKGKVAEEGTLIKGEVSNCTSISSSFNEEGIDNVSKSKSVFEEGNVNENHRESSESVITETSANGKFESSTVSEEGDYHGYLGESSELEKKETPVKGKISKSKPKFKVKRSKRKLSFAEEGIDNDGKETPDKEKNRKSKPKGNVKKSKQKIAIDAEGIYIENFGESSKLVQKETPNKEKEGINENFGESFKLKEKKTLTKGEVRKSKSKGKVKRSKQKGEEEGIVDENLGGSSKLVLKETSDKEKVSKSKPKDKVKRSKQKLSVTEGMDNENEGGSSNLVEKDILVKEKVTKPKYSSVPEEGMDNENFAGRLKSEKKETSSKGRGRFINPYNLPPPDENTCKISNYIKDSCKTLCKICNEPQGLTHMRSHTKTQHSLQITNYKEIHGPFEIIDVVYHKCQLCGKLCLLDSDNLGGHVKSTHKMKVAEYNEKYLIMDKNIKTTKNTKNSAKKEKLLKVLDDPAESDPTSSTAETVNTVAYVKLEANLNESVDEILVADLEESIDEGYQSYHDMFNEQDNIELAMETEQDNIELAMETETSSADLSPTSDKTETPNKVVDVNVDGNPEENVNEDYISEFSMLNGENNIEPAVCMVKVNDTPSSAESDPISVELESPHEILDVKLESNLKGKVDEDEDSYLSMFD